MSGEATSRGAGPTGVPPEPTTGRDGGTGGAPPEPTTGRDGGTGGAPPEPTTGRDGPQPGVDPATEPAGLESAAELGVPGDVASLVRMANQIASNVAHKPHEVAVARTAAHLSDFWHPSMIWTLESYVASGGDGLGPIASEALATLRPPPVRE